MAAITIAQLVAFLLFVCLPLAAIGVYLTYNLGYFLASVRRRVSGSVDELEGRHDAKSRRDEIEAELQSRKRNSKYGPGLDRLVVEASQATAEISIALKMLKETTGICCETHLLAADISGASDMEDIRWDPVCANLRQNVLATIDVAIDHLDSYPIVNRKILKQGLALRGFQRVCEDCELLKYSRADVPVLCRPAKLMGNEPCDKEAPEYA